MNVVVKKIIFILLLLMIIGNFSMIFYRFNRWSVKSTRMFISKHDRFVKWKSSGYVYNQSSTEKGNKNKKEKDSFSFENNKGHKYEKEHENKGHYEYKTDNQISKVKTRKITDDQVVPTNNDAEKLKTENSISPKKAVSITENPKGRTIPVKTISRPFNKIPIINVNKETVKTEERSLVKLKRKLGLLKDEKRDRVFFNQSILLNNQSSKEPLLGVRNKNLTEPQNNTQFDTISLLKDEERDREFFNQSILLNNRRSNEILLAIRKENLTKTQNKTQFHTTQNDLNYFANGKISKGNAETTKSLLTPRNKILGAIKELEAKRNSVTKNPLKILSFKQNISNNTSNEKHLKGKHYSSPPSQLTTRGEK